MLKLEAFVQSCLNICINIWMEKTVHTQSGQLVTLLTLEYQPRQSTIQPPPVSCQSALCLSVCLSMQFNLSVPFGCIAATQFDAVLDFKVPFSDNRTNKSVSAPPLSLSASSCNYNTSESKWWKAL